MSKLRASKIIKVINKGILMNPTEISFTKISKRLVDGAYENETEDKTITVLIYAGDSEFSGLKVDSKMEGTSYSSSKYKMIADKDAGLEINPKSAIKFKCLEGKMEIKAVYIIKAENIICGYMCDLERID